MKSLIKNVKAKILANKGSDALETAIKIVAYSLVAALALGGLAFAIIKAVNSSSSYVEAATACALQGAQVERTTSCSTGTSIGAPKDSDGKDIAGYLCCK